ncbi:hypothetical protein [Halopelagius fulvigenes]|uniref:Major capsid protein n=1 Tax=Halopelagius fulvigenes TaxID=1198324 RepID=A0ABD5TYN5_9EURY
MPTNVNYSGVPTETDMRNVLLPEPEEMFQFRNAYQVDSEAPNRDGDSVEYPAISEDFDGEMVEVEQGSDYPRADMNYDGVRAAWTDYGFEVVIHDNDIQDSTVNVTLATQMRMSEEEQRRLDGIAYSVLNANRNSTTIGTDGTDFNYNAAVSAYTTLVDAGYNPDRFVWFLSPDAWGDWITTNEFASSTETFADELRGAGPSVTEIMGRPALLTNTGDLGADEAMLVDTGVYGWESPRSSFDITRYREDSKKQWVYQVSGRIDWVPTEPDAALKVQGGV